MNLNLNGVSPVKYRWILEQNPASLNEATLTIDVVQGSSVDPSYTKLTLNLVKNTDRWRSVGHRLEQTMKMTTPLSLSSFRNSGREEGGSFSRHS